MIFEVEEKTKYSFFFHFILIVIAQGLQLP